MPLSPTEPDLDVGRRFLEANPPPGRVLLLAVTGSHHYGFSSPDSDLDLKGIHILPTRYFLGLTHPNEVHDRLQVFDGVECDLTTNELGRVLSLLLRGNGNILERIFSPYQVVQTPEVEVLRRLATGARSRESYHHYAGYFRGMQRENLKQDPPRAKSLLYTCRVALTGTWLLRTGEVVAHLPTLAHELGLSEIEELIDLKQQGQEKSPLSPDQATRFRALWPRLQSLLDEARDMSPLPPTAPNRAEVEQWLIEMRKAALS